MTINIFLLIISLLTLTSISCGPESKNKMDSKLFDESQKWCEDRFSTQAEINANCYSDWKYWVWDPKRGLVPMIVISSDNSSEPADPRKVIYSISPEVRAWSEAAQSEWQRQSEEKAKQLARQAIERFGSTEFLAQNKGQYRDNESTGANYKEKTAQIISRAKNLGNNFGTDIGKELQGNVKAEPADSTYPFKTSKDSEFGKELRNTLRYKDHVAEKVEKGPESQKTTGRGLLALAAEALAQADTSYVNGDIDGANFEKDRVAAAQLRKSNVRYCTQSFCLEGLKELSLDKTT